VVNDILSVILAATFIAWAVAISCLAIAIIAIIFWKDGNNEK
jgi:hypothetical protein